MYNDGNQFPKPIRCYGQHPTFRYVVREGEQIGPYLMWFFPICTPSLPRPAGLKKATWILVRLRLHLRGVSILSYFEKPRGLQRASQDAIGSQAIV